MNPELFYGRDLAYVHDQAFGHLARAGGETLLRLLARQGFDSGLWSSWAAAAASPPSF